MKQVGALDVDICGPSLPKMTGLEGELIHQSNSGWTPVYVSDNLGVMSIGFLMENSSDAVIWRGPKKNGLHNYNSLFTHLLTCVLLRSY